MGLFNLFKKKPETPAVAAVSAATGADVVASPVAGTTVAMADVPDPVFAGEMMGKGSAVWPSDETVYAPVSGTVTAIMGHALGIQGTDGAEVLVHIGVDTVEMNGDGFELLVSQDDAVVAGQPCIKMDREKIAAAGHPDCVMVVVTNTDEYASVEPAVAAGSTVEAGAVLVRLSR